MSSPIHSACDEHQRNLDRFLDGELDARSMRMTAMHVGRCPACEEQIRQLESLSARLEDAVRATADEIDSAALWRAVAAEIAVEARPSWGEVLRDWWARSRERRLAWRTPAFAASALAVALAVFWFRAGASSAPGAAVAHVADNQAQIDRLESSASQIVLWSEPQENTTAIWLASYEP